MGFTIGGLTITASYITGIIIPFTFANKYNANLKKKTWHCACGV
ncbi:conserved hypothetical protein (plasmid) [Borreliella burgdorferi WI91-23]|nr:conserved hypothetical protein [Borreliella burgdorferi WI91-23]